MSGTAQSSFAIPDDDALIASALEEASIPTLMMSMIHMSGDASLLDGTIRPAGVFINEYQGYMSEEDKATVRARALEMIKDFREGGCKLPSSPSPATIHRMMNFIVAGDVPEDYVPMMLEEMDIALKDLLSQSTLDGFSYYETWKQESYLTSPVSQT